MSKVQLSVAVGAVQVTMAPQSPASAVWLISAGVPVITGLSVSVTVMFWMWVVLLPQSSTATQVRTMPAQVVEATSLKDTLASLSQSSVAVSVAAAGMLPQSTVTSAGSVSTKEGATLSVTVMVCT